MQYHTNIVHKTHTYLLKKSKSKKAEVKFVFVYARNIIQLQQKLGTTEIKNCQRKQFVLGSS